MKILIVEEEFNKHKGVSRYAVELVEHLAKENEVHLLTVQYDYKVPGITVHRRPLMPVGGFAGAVAGRFLNSIYATRIGKKFGIDIIHSQGSESLVCDVVTMHSCHKAGIKQWNKISRRELGSLKYIIKKMARMLNPYNILTVFIEGRLLRTARKVLVISKVVQEEVMENYRCVNKSKIEVIYHGVDSVTFRPDERKRLAIKSQLGLKKDDLVVSFCGYEFGRKGLRYLIEVMPHLKRKVKLLVIGKDNEVPYRSLASRLGISQNVVFVGQISSGLNAYLDASDIFVFPTTHEAFGLVIMEAMSSGLPVVFSRLAGAADIVKDGYDALLLDDPTDVKEISIKVNALLVDEGLRRMIAVNARRTAEIYTWQSTINAIFRVYQELSAY